MIQDRALLIQKIVVQIYIQVVIFFFRLTYEKDFGVDEQFISWMHFLLKNIY